MNETKPVNNFNSPDLSKMQKVVIDMKTIIYIPLNADPQKAKTAYLNRVGLKKQ